MFRYAYCGFSPRFASAFAAAAAAASESPRYRSPRDRRHAQGRYYSWHSGPLLGVRRPIRYLAYRLDLDEKQVRELAAILDRLKTARAQVDVDWRRSEADLATALESDDFDDGRAAGAFDQRARSAEMLRTETLEALRCLHRLLEPDQRRELAYLLRSGGLSV